MKRLFTLISLLTIAAAACFAQVFESATEAVAHMRLGWNLGNTLDSNSGDVNNMWIEAWTQRTPADYETAWGQPQATQELMHMFHEAGFGAIRVPVTWYPHMGTVQIGFTTVNGQSRPTWNMNTWTGYDVDATWMARVKEVVDYVLNEGMYCILNVHHDTGASSTAWLKADTNVYNQQQERFTQLWQQIATTFRDYDERLLFEGYNEMLDANGSWNFPSSTGTYNANKAAASYEAINQYAQTFVNTVRATGGNNQWRNLVVCTYGACCGQGNWSQHLTEPLSQMQLPQDNVPDHLIFEIHTYPSISNLNGAMQDVKTIISRAKSYLVAKGAPVIFGEWGTSDGNDYNTRPTQTKQFARFFVEQAKAAGMGTFFWMGLSDGTDRSVPQWTQPELKDTIVKGYYGDGGYDALVSSPVAADHSDDAYYSLDGIRQEQPVSPGIYVNKKRKIIVR